MATRKRALSPYAGMMEGEYEDTRRVKTTHLQLSLLAQLSVSDVLSLLRELDIPEEHCERAREKIISTAGSEEDRKELSAQQMTIKDIPYNETSRLQTLLEEERARAATLLNTVQEKEALLQQMNARLECNQDEIDKLHSELNVFRQEAQEAQRIAPMLHKVRFYCRKADKEANGLQHPLWFASKAGDLEGVRALLEYGQHPALQSDECV